MSRASYLIIHLQIIRFWAFNLLSLIILLISHKGMPKMRKQLMTKKRQDGSTFMVMFSDFPSTNHCFLPPMGLEPSYSPCKDLIVAHIGDLVNYMSSKFTVSLLCAFPAQCSFLCLHWSVYFIHTTEELYSLLLWSYTHSHLALRDILQPLSTVSLKGQIG